LKITDTLIGIGDKADAIQYDKFNALSVIGDAGQSKHEIDGVKFAKLDFAGGGGGDELLVKLADPLIGISDTAIKFNFAKVELDYKEFSALNVIGDATNSKIELADFTGLVKLSLDGGGGLDDVKFSTGLPAVQLTDSAIIGGVNPIAQKGFESLSLLAVTDINNTFDGSKVTTLKLTMDGGSKDDVLLGGLLDDLLTGGMGINKISGGGGNDTLAESVDADFVASNSTLTEAGIDAFSSIEALKLTGGVGNNHFNTEPFKGKVTIDGGAGNDQLTAGAGADLLVGGLGNDSLNGGQGDDTLLANEGDDTLNGGPGTDFGDGGPGIDTGKGIETALNIER
jgi:Ca2+-binding RTX toxin-like protein